MVASTLVSLPLSGSLPLSVASGFNSADNGFVLLCAALVLLWVLCGYSLAFSPGSGPLAPFIGGLQWAGLPNWAAWRTRPNETCLTPLA